MIIWSILNLNKQNHLRSCAFVQIYYLKWSKTRDNAINAIECNNDINEPTLINTSRIERFIVCSFTKCNTFSQK